MLSFATEFPVSQVTTSAAFLSTVKKWILGSPHTKFTSDVFLNFSDSGSWSSNVGRESVQATLTKTGGEAAAVRWTTADGDIEWDTEVIFSRNETDCWVGVRTSRESKHPAIRLPPARKPFVVKTLLEDLGGANDGELPVSKAAFKLTNNDISLAARLITGNAKCRLPIVYVSCGFSDDYILDYDRLAFFLSGMAHVVVEPNRPFSRRLQIEVDSENIYGGHVGVYWPGSGGRRSVFIRRDFGDQKSISRDIFEEVRVALMNRRPLIRCTWSAVQEVASQEVLKSLKESGSGAIDKYVEAFDAELKAKDDQLEYAEKEIFRLSAEIRKYEAQTAIGKGMFLRTGDEQDFYAGEFRGIVRDALENGLTNVPSNSRREHVLKSILASLPEFEESKEYREKIKTILRDYRNLDAKIRNELEGMGFSIEDEGKHYKMTFRRDGRYMFVLSKSSSDHRAGLNLASDIARQVF